MKRACAGKLGSLVELLQGRLSQPVMELVTRQDGGLFPQPSEIEIECSCPDWAGLCKHAAAVLYGVGIRLDEQPELLFKLRKVDHLELINEAAVAPPVTKASRRRKAIAESDLGEVFGIELVVEQSGNQIKTVQSSHSVELTTAKAGRGSRKSSATRNRAHQLKTPSGKVSATTKPTSKGKPGKQPLKASAKPRSAVTRKLPKKIRSGAGGQKAAYTSTAHCCCSSTSSAMVKAGVVPRAIDSTVTWYSAASRTA